MRSTTLELLRIEREGYFNPAIRLPVDVEHEPRGGELDQAEPEVPTYLPRASLYSKRRHHSPRTGAVEGRRVSLARKDAHGGRELNTFRGCKRMPVVPINTSGRDRPISHQPIERDIFENVVAREAFRLTAEGACDECPTLRVVVNHPGGEADRGIVDPIQRLRTIRHLHRVTKTVRVEKTRADPTPASRQLRGRKEAARRTREPSKFPWDAGC
jgi:hypothetical protein